MDLTRQLFRLVLLGAINHQITNIVVAGSIFADFRRRAKELNPKLGELVTCNLCFGTWVGFLQALAFQPRFVEPLRQPPLLRRVIAFFADAFAIALAGRFFTQVLAVLANQAAVEKECEKLLEERVEQLEQGRPDESGEPIAKPS